MASNESLPRIEKAIKLVEENSVIELQYGRAIVNSMGIPYHVNYTSETCVCYDNVTNKFKCKHIWAAQFQRQRTVELKLHDR